MDELIKITPNKDKARSILKMVDTTQEMIQDIDIPFKHNKRVL